MLEPLDAANLPISVSLPSGCLDTPAMSFSELLEQPMSYDFLPNNVSPNFSITVIKASSLVLPSSPGEERCPQQCVRSCAQKCLLPTAQVDKCID